MYERSPPFTILSPTEMQQCHNAGLFHRPNQRVRNTLENKFFSDANQVVWWRTPSNVSAQERDVALTLHQWPRERTIIGVLGKWFLEDKCATRRRWALADSIITSKQPSFWMVVVSVFLVFLAFVLKEESTKVSVNQIQHDKNCI